MARAGDCTGARYRRKTWRLESGQGREGALRRQRNAPRLDAETMRRTEQMNNLRLLNHDILFERTGKVLDIADKEIQDAITRHCVKTGVKVLFIDNLSTAAFGLRENEADSWERMLPWLLDLRRRKIAVVIVHHAGRSGEMRGTSKREDSVFWIIALDDAKKNAEDKRGARFVSRFTKPSRNTQEDVPAFEWHFVTDEVTGEVSISHGLARTMDVFLGLIEDGVTECGHIAQERKSSPATVSRLAKKAIDCGKIITRNAVSFASARTFVRGPLRNQPHRELVYCALQFH